MYVRIIQSSVTTKLPIREISLLVATTLQTFHLLTSKETPLASLQVLLCDTCVIHSIEFLHSIAQVLEYASHDTVAARVNLYTNLLLCVTHISNLIGINLTILQRDTLCHLLHIGAGQGLIKRYLINLLLLQRGVCQLTSYVAIVCKEQQTERVLIQTSYGIDTTRRCRERRRYIWY